ncbi:HNH endonuclease [Undibacterium sp. Rencai35W]
MVPWSKGGETVLANLQTLCSVCNLGKSNVHPG